MEKFFGEVEVDETYVGPKFKNRKRKKREKLRKIDVVKRGRGVRILLQPIFGIYQICKRYRQENIAEDYHRKNCS